MTDRVVQYPNRYQLVPVAGTTDIYDLVAVPGVISAAGTSLNKANILPDTTRAALNSALGITLPTDATINDVFAALAVTPVQIVAGSYTGTGTYGSANPNSLTFDFEPKMLVLFDSKGLVLSQSTGGTYGELAAIGYCPALTTSYVQQALFNNEFNYDGTRYYTFAKKSSDGKTVFWYHTYDAGKQYNYSSKTYLYLAIG